MGPDATERIRTEARRMPYESVVQRALESQPEAAAEAETLLHAMNARKP
jgi:hypothetical protein